MHLLVLSFPARLAAWLLLGLATTTWALAQPAIVRSEFVIAEDEQPFDECHASTLLEVDGDGTLLVAWFAGSREGASDVEIWLARRERDDGGDGDFSWTVPRVIASASLDGQAMPTWNPVLHQQRAQAPIELFFKAGPSPREWWGLVQRSADGGETWSEAQRLPESFLGPIRSKPLAIGEALLMGSSTEHAGWRAHFEWRDENGQWTHIAIPGQQPGVEQEDQIDAIQPALLDHGEAGLQALFRTRQDRIAESWSRDGGRTWSALGLTHLPNPSAGVETVAAGDGTQLLVYNPTVSALGWPRSRSRLSVARTANGIDWYEMLELENDEAKGSADRPGEYSYPAAISGGDGLVHITYTWRRQNIRHLVIDPAQLPAMTPERRIPSPP